MLIPACAADTKPNDRAPDPVTKVDLQAIAAARAMTEFSAWGDQSVVAPNSVRLEEVLPRRGSIRVWRAWIQRDHWHPYTMAVADGAVIALGGFEAPELNRVAPFLIDSSADIKQLVAMARELAKLADPSGALNIAFPMAIPVDDDSVALSWRRPTSWPSDTTISSFDGGWQIRLTMLTQETRSYSQHWTPFLFVFKFDREGELKAWSRRIGEPFGAFGQIPPARMR